MKYLIGSQSKSAKAMNKTMTFFGVGQIVEVSSLQLASGLLLMKTLFEKMQLGDQLAKCLDTCHLVEALGFPPDVQQCAFEVWTSLFAFYFDFLSLRQYYTFKTNTITEEVRTPGKDDSELRKSVKNDIFETNLMCGFHIPNKRK